MHYSMQPFGLPSRSIELSIIQLRHNRRFGSLIILSEATLKPVIRYINGFSLTEH
jgi:hypothetical protein